MTRFVRTKRTLDRVHVDTDVYTLALERTAYIMDNHDLVRVHFSGGKDSTAVLNVALEVAHSDPRYARHLPLKTVFFDEEAIPQQTADYVERVAARDDIDMEWYCLPVQHRNACSRLHPYWWPWAPEDKDRWCRPLPERAITAHPKFTVWPREARPTVPDFAHSLPDPPHSTAMLMGIRAQESLTRARAVTGRKIDNFIIGPVAGSMAAYKAYPIYDWRTEDVWAAPAQLGWDYNTSYDLLEMAGVPASMQRCSPAFGEEPLQKIHTFAQCFPDVWARMAERVPGIGAAQRYALTELYAYRDKPTRPDGMPWPEFLLHYVAKFGDKDRARIADRIKKDIRFHYRCTTDPILPKAPHPLTGVSWNHLLAIAMRGDFKGRRAPATNVDNNLIGRYWRAYGSELAAVISSGDWAPLGYTGDRFPADAWALVPAEHRPEARPAPPGQLSVRPPDNPRTTGQP